MSHILAAIMGALTGYGLASLAAYLRPPERGAPGGDHTPFNLVPMTRQDWRDYDVVASQRSGPPYERLGV